MDSENGRCKIVLCDDQEGFRRLVAIVLGLATGIEVVGEASDGREAIAVVERLRPDVLLLDVAMPEMDGLEALPRVREVSPATRVVMLTGVTANSVRERALAAGASAFIKKGIDIDELGQRIVEICRAPSASR